MPRALLEGYICRKCSHVWPPRFERRPKVCPKCKAYDWDDEVPIKSNAPSE